MRITVSILLLLFVQDHAVQDLIDKLGSDDITEREDATDALMKLGEKAVPELKKAAAVDDPEVSARANRILDRILILEKARIDLFGGRGDSRKAALKKGGGDAETEKAVLGALQWLARHQGRDGSWSVEGLRESCAEESNCGKSLGSSEWDVGVTALSLLAFLGAGHTSASKDKHDGVVFGEVVRKALVYLLRKQEKNGGFSPLSTKPNYNSAIATLALVEALCLDPSKDRWKRPAKKAVAYLIAQQNPGGGWRYRKGKKSDTSVSMWATMALYVARSIGFRIQKKVLDGAAGWFDSVTEENYYRVGYTHKGTGKVFFPGRNETFTHHETLTAGGVLGRMLIRRDKGDPRSSGGLNLIIRDMPRWTKIETDFYYWHFGTMALFQFQGWDGRHWESWNQNLRDQLLPNQGAKGCGRGSWAPEGRWCCEGGRVYATAINALTLQTYYRYTRIRWK